MTQTSTTVRSGHRENRIFASSILAASLAAITAAAAPATDGGSAPRAGHHTDPVRPGATWWLPEPANPALPSLFLIGDSTVRNGRDKGQGKGPAGQWGWGHLISEYFDASKINIVNRAVGGLSSRTYLTGGFWERTLKRVRPGDFVIMQFGHNDGGRVNDRFRARASIKGIGEETEAIENMLTGKHEVVHTYGWYLRKYISDTRAKGATPIVCSLIPRKIWGKDGRIVRNTHDYAGWAEQVARQEHVAFVDLNGTVAERYDALGRDAVMKLFPTETPDQHTHTNWYGADLNARMVIAGLKALQTDPLAQYFSGYAAEIVPAPPAKHPEGAARDRRIGPP